MSTLKASYPMYYVVRDTTGDQPPLVLPWDAEEMMDVIDVSHQWLRHKCGGRYPLEALCRILDRAWLSRPDIGISGGACRATSVQTLTKAALEGAGIETSWNVLESDEFPFRVYVSLSEDECDSELEVRLAPATGRIMVQDYYDGLYACPRDLVLLPSSEAEWLSGVLYRYLEWERQ